MKNSIYCLSLLIVTLNLHGSLGTINQFLETRHGAIKTFLNAAKQQFERRINLATYTNRSLSEQDKKLDLPKITFESKGKGFSGNFFNTTQEKDFTTLIFPFNEVYDIKLIITNVTSKEDERFQSISYKTSAELIEHKKTPTIPTLAEALAEEAANPFQYQYLPIVE